MHKETNPPSIFTTLYWLIQDKKVRPNFLFEISEIYWPTFIKKEEYIFLKEKFTEKEYTKLIQEDSNPEYWINMLTVDDYFSSMPDSNELSESFARNLAKIWDTKLKKDFPALKFKVVYLFDNDSGDHGLTFFQTKD